MFGLKQLRISNDTVFVVEGYFDVLTLHQAGFKNTVGLLGTELSAEQMRVLENLARNAILIFDGDPGGQAALLRCLKVPRHNLIVKAVVLPEGDPDEIVREGRTAEFEALIEKAKPLREAAIEIISQRKGKESIEHLTEEVTRLGTEIPDALEASFFAQEAAEALSLPAWVLQEKIQARREKKERIVERKRQLEKFLVNELLANPTLIPDRKTGIDQGSLRRRRRKENASDPNPETRLGRPLKKTHMRRCARSPRSNVLIEYASARRFFTRLASESF